MTHLLTHWPHALMTHMPCAPMTHLLTHGPYALMTHMPCAPMTHLLTDGPYALMTHLIQRYLNTAPQSGCNLKLDLV